MNKQSNGLASAGVLSAIAASLCCITPVLALISGASGIAASFSWLEPIRPFLIGITGLVLAFAWYQKLKPSTAEAIECACEEDAKPSFWQTKNFLVIVTVFAGLMLAFPLYAHVFYPSSHDKQLVIVDASDVQTVTFEVKGMTCNGCAAHVENDVNKLPGIITVEASYPEASAKVSFDQSKVKLAQIEAAINGTGYQVVGRK